MTETLLSRFCFLHIDDLSSAEKDVNNAHEFFCKCKDRLNNGNFNFRKFQSNSTRLKMLVKMKNTLNDDIKSTRENQILRIGNKEDNNFFFDFM